MTYETSDHQRTEENAQKLLGEQTYEAWRRRHIDKLTYKEIGKLLGCGPSHARQKVLFAERKLHQNPSEFDFLGTKAQKFLSEMGCKTKQDVIEKYRDGAINRKKLGKEYGIRYAYGIKTHKEILEWLGIKEKIQRKNLCPHCGGVFC